MNKVARLLFVEDEPLALELMAKSLVDQGYSLKSFSNPVSALEWLNSNPGSIDLLITDQSMPEMTGVELSHRARDLIAGLPVVIVTGMGKIEENLSKSGPVRLVEKPYKRKQLFDAIAEILKE